MNLHLLVKDQDTGFGKILLSLAIWLAAETSKKFIYFILKISQSMIEGWTRNG